MTYNEVLIELEKHNLRQKFQDLFENKISSELLELVKSSDKIRSAPRLIRTLISHLEFESKQYFEWVKILQYLMKPEFEREKIVLNSNIKQIETKQLKLEL